MMARKYEPVTNIRKAANRAWEKYEKTKLLEDYVHAKNLTRLVEAEDKRQWEEKKNDR